MNAAVKVVNALHEVNSIATLENLALT